MAFAALMAEGAEVQPTTPAAQPPPATAPAPTPAPAEPPASQQPPASEPPAPEAETDEPTQAEMATKLVPLKKLTRSLESRREARVKAEQLEAELTKEREITDRVIDTFQHMGVAPDQLQPFLASLARAKSDQQARDMAMRFLGIQAPQAAPSPAVDQARLMHALEAYDTATVRDMLASAGILAAHQAPPAPPQVQPAQPPPQPPPVQPSRPADPAAANVLYQTVSTMGAVLRAQYGEQEAKRIANAIDAEAKQQVQNLERLKVKMDETSLAEIWKAAQETVIRRDAATRVQPQPQPAAPPPAAPPVIRPGMPAPPRSKTADEQFADLVAGRA
jgi:hypothetical protein